jgi:small subunit ribosomal protein S14
VSITHIKDKFHRDFRAKLDVPLKSLSSISCNTRLPNTVRSNAEYRLNAFSSVIINPRSVCMISGRSRAVFRLFKLSRVKLRELGSLGRVPGFRKR